MRLVLRSAVLALVAGVALAGCSSDSGSEPADRPSASTTTPVPVTEETSEVPEGSGTGDVIGTIGDISPDDDWKVSCSDTGGGGVLVNAVGSAPNTIQATVVKGEVTRMTISYDELLVTVPDGSGLSVRTVADGYAFSGSVDVPGSGPQKVTLELDCGA
ncbi:hypothetical protein ASD11_12105 [Aeromicrobium sp. Root495]|uniref:hypothetical protein n=1 Tax=Aeromicrobium sp. Root495 TaxID=1736550 RepID=UPI0006FB25F5|nr:hypothetical protein [Aeromicrobium sp. Root495]KQY60205.1 hypothetical protein ASD11_12105 [Aeromicrobium sp. Root495]